MRSALKLSISMDVGFTYVVVLVLSCKEVVFHVHTGTVLGKVANQGSLFCMVMVSVGITGFTGLV